MEEVKISMDRNNRGHSYKITIVIVGFMLRIVVLMQLVLRPLFLAFNWSCLDEKYRNAGHLLNIARYGFAQDCAMAGYFAAPLLLLMILPDKCRRLKQRSILDYFYACGHKSYTSLTDFPDVKQSWRSGVPDGRTFDWLYDNIMHRKAGQKWMMSFLTLSSHDPFTVPYKRLKDKRDNAFAYTDSCVGAFVDKLKKTPQWKNTLIVLTSDHSFIYTPQIDVTDTVYAHIPIMFLGGAIEKPQRVNRIVSQVDIAATLLSLMHLPHIQFPFSKNVLSKDYTYPYAWNCYNNGFMFRDSTGCTVYDMNQNKVTYGYDKVRLEKAKAYVQKIYEDLNRR